MREDEWTQKLKDEGFTNISVWEDMPSVFHAAHKHEKATTHVILEGEMMITASNKTKFFKRGERFDVPAGQIHSAKTGNKGCKYIIGEKDEPK